MCAFSTALNCRWLATTLRDVVECVLDWQREDSAFLLPISAQPWWTSPDFTGRKRKIPPSTCWSQLLGGKVGFKRFWKVCIIEKDPSAIKSPISNQIHTQYYCSRVKIVSNNIFYLHSFKKVRCKIQTPVAMLGDVIYASENGAGLLHFFPPTNKHSHRLTTRINFFRRVLCYKSPGRNMSH